MTDLKDKTVEQLWKDLQKRMEGWPIYTYGFVIEIFNELARRLEETQQKIVAQQARIATALVNGAATGFLDDTKSRFQRIRATLQAADLSDLAALKAEVAAKALEEGAAICDELILYTGYDCSISLRNRAAEYRAKAGRKE